MPAIVRAVLVWHIFRNSLFMLAYCRVCFSFRKLHFQASHRNANPTQELSFIHSFRFIRSFHYRHFCLSTLQIHVLAAWLHYIQLSLSTLHKNALPFIHSLQLHSLTTVSPCHFQRTVRAKKCAKPAASSTLPQRFALSVSGALTQHADGTPTTHSLKTSFRYTTFRF